MRFLRVDDHVRIELPAAERAFLEGLVPMLEGIGVDRADPAADRLHPRAFADDGAQADYDALTAEDLALSRAADRAVFSEVLARTEEGTTEPIATAEAWLRVLTEARLTLAARWQAIGAAGDSDGASVPHHRAALLDYLAMLQQDLVEEVMSAMAGDV